MTKEKLADRIKQLVNITQTLLFYSDKFRELYDKYLPATAMERQRYDTSEISMAIRFLHCSLFYDVLLNLNTMLSPIQKDPDKKEQSLFELIDLETNQLKKENLLSKANEFRKQLEENNLHKWRNKLVGHKDIENAGDTVVMYLNFIKIDIIKFSEDLINQIDDFINNNYDVAYNNTFSQMYSRSFEKMIDLFEQELKKMVQNHDF
jgi:hypothetical protein